MDNRKQQQEQIQMRFKMLDDVFHTVIIALERLEKYLEVERGLLDGTSEHNAITAMGDDRDLHNDNVNPPTRKLFYGEVQFQCTTLFFQTQLDSKDAFVKVQKYFLRDLLEWYGGRTNSQPNDVEKFFIPIVGSLSREITSVAQVMELVKKYVCDIDLNMDNYTDEEKEKAIEDGYIAFVKGRNAYNNKIKKFQKSGKDAEFSVHKRGEAFDGYKHLKAAFQVFYEDETPIKLLDKLVSLYLPELLENQSEESTENGGAATSDEAPQGQSTNANAESENEIPEAEKPMEADNDGSGKEENESDGKKKEVED